MAQLEHIEEGFAYHDGESRQLYDTNDVASAEAVLFQQCVNWSIGVLSVQACIDTSVPSVSLTVTLAGFQLANCTLSPSNPSCTVGGSVDGFKAEVSITFDPNAPSITISGQLCAPFVGCKSFSVTIPFG